MSAWIVKAHDSTVFQQPLSSSLPTLQNISPVTSQVKVKSSDLNLLLFALVLLTNLHIDFHDLYIYIVEDATTAAAADDDDDDDDVEDEDDDDDYVYYN